MPSIGAESHLSVHVAVAVIVDDRRQVLLTQRHPDSHQGGLWEFPGGKLEADESLADALRRELQEELGIDVQSHQPLLVIEHDYGDKRVLLDVHRVDAFAGVPVAREGQPMRWVPVSELNEYAFPAANKPIVERLQEN